MGIVIKIVQLILALGLLVFVRLSWGIFCLLVCLR